MSVRILQGDALTMLRTLPERSVQCVVTSPPYFQLRDYGVDGQIGLERTPAAFLDALYAVFDEVRRVLRDDGCVFVNLGDSYAGSGRGPTGENGIGDQRRRQGFIPGEGGDQGGARNRDGVGRIQGFRAKSLLLIPERFAIGMADRGWIVRSQIVWAKKSPMPESVRDRPTSAWEPIWMFTKQARYFWDSAAVAEPSVSDHPSGNGYNRPERLSMGGRGQDEPWQVQATRNLRNVWSLSPEPSRDEHYAAYPTEIPRRCILAATSERGQCPACGAPWARVVERDGASKWAADDDIRDFNNDGRTANPQSSKSLHRQKGGVYSTAKVLGWEAGCACDAGDPVPQVVLDPFLGSGTTALVADRLERNAIGIELNEKYVQLAERRLRSDSPMFADVEVAS